jgi:hypothetical protein
MKTMNGTTLEQIQGGGWLADFGGGMACGLAIGSAFGSGGIAIPIAIATCAWALG